GERGRGGGKQDQRSNQDGRAGGVSPPRAPSRGAHAPRSQRQVKVRYTGVVSMHGGSPAGGRAAGPSRSRLTGAGTLTVKPSTTPSIRATGRWPTKVNSATASQRARPPQSRVAALSTSVSSTAN